MPQSIRRRLVLPSVLAFAGSFVSVVVATDTDAILASETPISTALSAVDADVLRFNDHLTTLASPYMAGRVPGEPGMERAMQYCEFWFTEFGLEPAFEDEAGEPTFRQPFDLGGRMELVSSEASFKRGLRRVNLIEDEDYIATALGTSDSVTAPMIFVGYSVEDGPDGYTNFEGADVEGKIAVFFRFEPMDDGGNSAFQDGRGWTGRAGFRRKLNAVFDRGAAGAIIINPPGSSDPRAETLSPVGGGGGGTGPVLMLSQAGGEKLVERFDPEGRSLMELRRFADTEGGWFDMQGRGTIEARFERTPTVVENVAALLPGRGDLADEVIVIGAHLDHLGMGYFGSRSGPGELHAGADDNASGSAGVLLIAEKLKEAYDRLPDDADARTIKLVLFTAEESGLNGSRYMAQNPTRFAIEDHVLMINFDMIGRIENDRLSVSGMNTGVGLMEFCEPFFADSGLDCVVAERMSGASDHTSYYDQGVPVLFAIIADFHEDYHTPADVSEKINRVGATKTARLYTRIALAAAQRTERFEFTRQAPRQRAGGGGGAPGRMDIRVRFGVQPSYTEDLGVGINAVTDGGSAGVAGVEAGDVLVRWDGQKVENIEAWMGMLSQHDPGDVIKIGVLRDDVEVTLEVTLQGR